MKSQIISASSYSNTAPLIWSFLYGSLHGKYELVLDTAPSRSAELLSRNEVDAALVPVIAAQLIDGISVIPDVCVGAKEKVRSVCLVTLGKELANVKSVSLDVSSKTSVVLTKIIFAEFLGFEPKWINAEPNLDEMLAKSDAALLIGDPALNIDEGKYRKFDLVELWKKFTGFGFVFAMWMTKRENIYIDFAGARDEGVAHLKEIIANYEGEISLTHEDLKEYLTENISFSIDESMQNGLELYFHLANKTGSIDNLRKLQFAKRST